MSNVPEKDFEFFLFSFNGHHFSSVPSSVICNWWHKVTPFSLWQLSCHRFWSSVTTSYNGEKWFERREKWTGKWRTQLMRGYREGVNDAWSLRRHLFKQLWALNYTWSTARFVPKHSCHFRWPKTINTVLAKKGTPDFLAPDDWMTPAGVPLLIWSKLLNGS